MKTTLKHIATIQTGVFAKPVSNGEIVYLQAKYFNENGQLNTPLQPDLKADNLIERHLLKHGDVLFAAKGTKNFASWYESKDQPAVASTSFFVIRLTESFRSMVMPEYLVWLINTPSSQKILKGKAIGTDIASISKSVLEDLGISIPDLHMQKTILRIAQLRENEKNIKQQIETLREKQIQQQILDRIK